MKNKILEYIQSELLDERQDISDGQDLLTTGMIDSIGIMRLVAFLEKEFTQTIPPADVTLENFSDVNAIAEYILRNKG